MSMPMESSRRPRRSLDDNEDDEGVSMDQPRKKQQPLATSDDVDELKVSMEQPRKKQPLVTSDYDEELKVSMEQPIVKKQQPIATFDDADELKVEQPTVKKQQPIVTSDDAYELKVSMQQPIVKKQQPIVTPNDEDYVEKLTLDYEAKLKSRSNDEDYEAKLTLDYGMKLKNFYIGKLKEENSRRLADLGVPMPSGMVLSKYTRYMIPMLKYIVVEEAKNIDDLQVCIDRKGLINLFLMLVVMFVILVVHCYDPRYAVLGYGLKFWCIYAVCSLTYVLWLRKKEKELEKYWASLGEWALEQRKKLPIVEVDNVNADQHATDMINLLCCQARAPLYLITTAWIQYALLVGVTGILYTS